MQQKFKHSKERYLRLKVWQVWAIELQSVVSILFIRSFDRPQHYCEHLLSCHHGGLRGHLGQGGLGRAGQAQVLEWGEGIRCHMMMFSNTDLHIPGGALSARGQQPDGVAGADQVHGPGPHVRPQEQGGQSGQGSGAQATLGPGGLHWSVETSCGCYTNRKRHVVIFQRVTRCWASQCRPVSPSPLGACPSGACWVVSASGSWPLPGPSAASRCWGTPGPSCPPPPGASRSGTCGGRASGCAASGQMCSVIRSKTNFSLCSTNIRKWRSIGLRKSPEGRQTLILCGQGRRVRKLKLKSICCFKFLSISLLLPSCFNLETLHL